MRVLTVLLLLCGLLLPAAAPLPALAQPAAPPPAVAAGEAQRLLGLLRDEGRRNELMRTLEALAAAERRGTATGQAPAPAPTPAPAATPPASASGAAPAAPPPASASGAEPPGTAAGATPAGATPAGATPAGATPSGAPPPAAGTAPAAGTPAAAATPAPEAPAEPLLAPNTLGGQLLIGVSHRMEWLSEQLFRAAEAVTDLPALVSWFSNMARDPVTQARVADASWKLLLLFGLGVLAEWLAHRALRHPRERLDSLAPEPGASWNWLRRVPLVLARLVLDLLPVAAFALVSYGLIGAVQPLPTTQLVLLTANNAYIACRLVMALSRMLFSPASSHLRLIPAADLTAAYVTIWLRRIVVVLVLGFAVAEAGLLFGLPWGAYDAIIRLVLLIVSLFLGIIVLQNRVAVAQWLRAPPLKPGDVPHASRRGLRRFRDWLAEVWHFLAILYLLALWAVWALEIHDGFTRLLRASVLTLVVLGVAKLVDLALRRVVTGSFSIAPDLLGRFPGLEGRANRYLPVLKGVISTVMTLLTLLLLLEVWGINSFSWFTPGALGSRLIRFVLSVGFTAALAVVVWEACNAAIARHLARLSRDAQAARSARVRTLVPMLRTTLLIVILLFVGFNVLTEIGVNVAPLLAGAGVIGLAIGFGAQKLVQDVITGVFLLFEDAMTVGDVVNLGGKGGVVEQLSIRSIKLRDTDGSVHIIPFSTVTSVTNMTRDFSFAVIDIQVAYREDTDRVLEVLSSLCAEMRTEPKWSVAIRDEMEVLGVDMLSPDGPVLRVRIKTEPIQRWNVRREMNRRIKQRFDALGIEIPAARQTLMFQGVPPALPPPPAPAT